MFIPKIEIIPFQLNVLINNSIIYAIEQLSNNIYIQSKWPNDLYVEGKKLVGVLIEGLNNEYYIIGVGINTNNEISLPTASSLKDVIGERIDNKLLLKAIISNFETLLNANYEKEFIFWKSRNLLLNKKVEIRKNNDIIKGKVMDILSNGSLLVDNKKIISGEVINFE